MSHIVQDFQQWKKINEADDAPSRERERGTISNKVVAIPVDKTTLKLKIVNDADVLNAEGKLTTEGFKALLEWIKKQQSIITYYTGLNDLAKNIVIYTVAKDNDRKQVVLFKIYSKEELKQGDKAINPAVPFIRQDELTQALGGTLLNTMGGTSTVTTQAPQGAGNLILPVKSGAILNSTSAPLIKFITDAYNKVKTKITGNPILPKVKSEVQASKLGTGSQTFVKALNAGYGILDTQFGEDTEVNITQSLVDKLVKPEELDVDSFNKVAPLKEVVSTGDIKVPGGGFKEGIQDNSEMKKVQDLLLRKFRRHLANHGTYQKFAKAGEKGFKGNYGPLTHNLISLLKAITKDPAYPNRDGSVIEPDFIAMIQKVNENISQYLALDGVTLITESTFDFGEAEAISPSSTSTPTKAKSGATTSKTKITLKPENFNVKAFQNWVINTKKESGWATSDADGIWGPKTAAAYSKYKAEYKPTEKSKESTSISFNELDKSFINLGNSIKSFIEDSSNFQAYTDPVNDEEEGAWNDVVIPHWKNTWKPELIKLEKKVNMLADGSDKDRYKSTVKKIYSMFYTDTSLLRGSDTFYSIFLGDSFSDKYKLILKLSGSKVEAIKINTDFEEL